MPVCRLAHILTDLKETGVQVSTDKTLILLALSGQAYDKITAPFTFRKHKDRFLKVSTPSGPVNVPIKQSHKYLEVKIGYQHFERQTVAYRIQQSWQAFHRLACFLWSKKISLQHRLRLWTACVHSIARYGLDSVGLDEVSAAKYRAHIARQVRIISFSPGRLTHESNLQLHARLCIADPVESLTERVKNCRAHLHHLQPAAVQQRWTTLLSELNLRCAPDHAQKGGLTEITQVAHVACSCDICGQQFLSFHAVRAHIGKTHPESSVALTKTSYAVRSAGSDDHMRFALQGRPQCNKCLRQAAGQHIWPISISELVLLCALLNLGLHSEEPHAPTLAQGALAPEYVPVNLFDSTVETAKQGDLTALALHLRTHCQPDRCPECGVSCQPMYWARHACKQH